jgi:hypothetical protein
MWTEAQTALYVEPTATLLKKLFAAEWLRTPDNPFEAARKVEQHPGKAIWIGQNWTTDEAVLAEKARLMAALGPIAKVPDKNTFAAEIYENARECKTAGDKLAFFKFFAQVMGYTADAPGVNVNVLQGAKIMAVPVAASDDDWEASARKHQELLLSRHG